MTVATRPAVGALLVAFLLLGAYAHASGQSAARQVVRIGFFANVTQSQALVGLARGDFAKSLGPEVKVEARAFNAGPSVIEALFAGQLDVAYVGPNPAINGYVKSRGEALRVVAGAASGGASLVVRAGSGIRSPRGLDGRTIATPQLGNTQDVALRGYLATLGLSPRENGGTVAIVPMDNPAILEAFRLGRIDGAWVPEPWASRLEVEGNGQLLIDERTLWPGGEFATALIIASRRMLNERRNELKSILRAHVKITRWELASADAALRAANEEIKEVTGAELPLPTLQRAWARMKPTWDPLTATLQRSADNAFAAGFLKSRADLSGLVDAGPLNEVLAEEHLPPLEGR
ncbi:MAG TPA: ABC transporter substrate-binding protein [Spirochaetia bacterium]|nr:ABC transporter substrate-binding protein [Spirochaetia bacterium]